MDEEVYSSAVLRGSQADGEIIAERSLGFQLHIATTLDGTFLRLLHQDRVDETVYQGLVWK